MKKFFMNILGIEATSSCIRGRKSSGCEDGGGYKYWRKDYFDTNESSLN
jgi:hypothetical protein